MLSVCKAGSETAAEPEILAPRMSCRQEGPPFYPLLPSQLWANHVLLKTYSLTQTKPNTKRNVMSAFAFVPFVTANLKLFKE